MAAGSASQAFGRSRRVIWTREFDRAYKASHRAADEYLTIYTFPNGLPHSRLGLSVGRRVGGAVVRNRVKRLLREAFRTSLPRLPAGFDFIAVAQKRACNAPFGTVQCSLVALGERAAKRWEK